MAAASGGEQAPGQLGILWWVGGIAILSVGIWYFARNEIIMGFLFLKHGEIAAIQFFLPVLEKMKAFIVSTPPSQITFHSVKFIAKQTGEYIKYPASAILCLFAITLFFRSSAARYKTVYNMKTLLNAELQNWPQESITAPLDLVKMDPDKGKWAMGSTPMKFAKKHKLIDEDKLAQQIRDPQRTATLLRTRATGIFVMQLGPLWTNINDLKPHTKALFAAFAARACRDTKASQAFLRKIAESAKTGKPKFTGTRELLNKHIGSDEVGEAVGRHAYIMTIMAELLMQARSDGVLATADFLWLKPLDRRLWYMLNSIGRQVAYTEIAGPYAHYLAEKKYGSPIKKPMVDAAVDALENALAEILYTD